MWMYIFLAVILFLWWQVRMALKEKSEPPDSRLPGPKPVPVLGNILQLNVPRPDIKMAEFAETFGPIYKLKTLNEHWVVASDPDLIREITKSQIFSGRPTSFRLNYMVKHLGIPISRDLDADGRTVRQLMAKALKGSTGLKDMDDVSISIIKEIMDVFDSHQQAAFDPMRDVSRCFVRLIAKLLLNEHVEMTGQLMDIFLDINFVMMEALSTGGDGLVLDTFPWTRIFNPYAWRMCHESRKLTDTLYQKYKPRIMATLDEASDQSVMHFVFNKMKQSDGSIDDGIGKGIMAGLIVGGIDTTSVSLCTLFGVLAHHPHIQIRIQQEVDDIIGGRTPSLDDHNDCHYTEAVLLEVSRNAGMAPILFPHKAMQNSILGGYEIPKDVLVVANVWALNDNPEFWDNPFEYDPERFLDVDGHLVPPDHTRRCLLFPFGGGPRGCPGEAFAKGRLFLIVSAVCQRFNIRPEGQVNASLMDPRNFKTHGPAIHASNLKVRFIERK